MKLCSTFIAAIAMTLATGSAPAAGASEVGPERLIYEIVVTNPGTRSQGWDGALLQQGLVLLPVQPGQIVQTNFGRFVGVACVELFKPCGYIEQRMNASLSNTNMGPTPWRYRLFVSAECRRSETLRGELLRGGQAIGGVPGDTIETPMGTYQWRAGTYESGWYHNLSPQHMLTPGAWPCPH